MRINRPSIIVLVSVRVYYNQYQAMNLNPFNPNYLNHMSFPTKMQKKPSRPQISSKQKQILVQSRSQIQQNIPQASNIPMYRSMVAKFPLQNYLNTCYLHYTYQGYLFAYLKKQNIISGKAFIIFPQGIIANCNIINRKLSGWLSVCRKNQFYNISHFFGGKFHGDQYTYDVKQNIMVQSKYQSGKLQSVKRGIADSRISFEKCLKNKQLVELLHQTLSCSFYEKYLPKVESQLGNYYGFKKGKMPNGIGIVVTQDQYFYGNFQNGLLSGDGVMIFPNGNSYIGSFQSGMMKGFGNYVTNGQSIFKLNSTLISQEQFNSQKEVQSFYENEQISSIFSPIVNFYQKLKVIYQNRRKQDVEQSQSFVNVQVEETDEKYQEKQESSSYYSPREDIISQLLKNTPKSTNHQQNFVRQAETKRLTKKENAIGKQKTDRQKKEEQTQVPHKKKKKQKWIARNDKQWEEIIEQLGQQQVSKQDDFLAPQEEKVQTKDSQPLTKNPNNSRMNTNNMIKITDSPPDKMDKLQNQLINKIITKK